MRLSFGSVAVVVVVAVMGIGSTGWMSKAQSGLGQLMSGTISSAGLSSAGEAGASKIAWHGPGGAGDQAVALSEQDWLKLSEDVAPVSYLDQAPADSDATADSEAQPL